MTTIICSQHIQPNVLAALFTSTARVAVLRVFLIDPIRTYYQRQLEEATGLPLRAIQRELERLCAAGLLYRRAEGNRTYYQVDMDFVLFPELRSMVLKSLPPVDALRAELALDDAVRLAFLGESRTQVLVVTRSARRIGVSAPAGITVETMTSEEFARALAGKAAALETYLVRGIDLLGRRDDVIWRHIEAAGYDVKKGEGVP